MLVNKQCEVITLSDDDDDTTRHHGDSSGQQHAVMMVPPHYSTNTVNAYGHGAPPQHHHVQQQQRSSDSENYGASSMPSNSAALPNTQLSLHEQRMKKLQQHQALLDDMLKREKGMASNDAHMVVHQQNKPPTPPLHQPPPQRLAQATGSGGFMTTIMNERPVDIKALLLNSRRKPILFPPPPPPPKNSTMTVKEQLILYFQQQHKLETHYQQQHKTTTAATTTSSTIIAPDINRNALTAQQCSNGILQSEQKLETQYRQQYKTAATTTTTTIVSDVNRNALTAQQCSNGILRSEHKLETQYRQQLKPASAMTTIAPNVKKNAHTAQQCSNSILQSEHKLETQYRQQLKSTSAMTTTAPVANRNAHTAQQYSNAILQCALKRQLCPEARSKLNIAKLLAAYKQKTEMMTTRNKSNNSLKNGINGKRLHPESISVSVFCNTYVEAQNKKTTTNFGAVDEEFTGQFQCTFQGCNKRLKNNVMFIHHIWAHVVQQKPQDNDEQFTNLQLLMMENNGGGGGAAGGGNMATADEQLSDVSRLHMCSECLLVQPTPFRARLHFHRVHKRGKRPLLDGKHSLNVCNICEQVIDARLMVQHIKCHQERAQLSMPYSCRFSAGIKCQFRTSNRSALIRHFCTRHVGTHVLLCPFCLVTFSVPPADKRGTLVRMREFIRHMTLHDGEKSKPCGFCVIKVPSSLRSQMALHQEQHLRHTTSDQKWLQWQMQRLDLKCVVPDKSCALVSTDASIPQCVECGQMMNNNLDRHLGKEKRRCTFCAFFTHCAHAMDRHCLLAQCNPANAARTPFAGWKSSTTFAPYKLRAASTTAAAASLSSSSLPSSSMSLVQFACTLCHAFRSANVQTLAEHIIKVHHHHGGEGARRRFARLIYAANTTKSLLLVNNKNGAGGGGEQHLQQLSVVEEKLKQYREELAKKELHEAELFGLRLMGDAPMETFDDDDAHNQRPSPAITTTTGEHSEMRDWLLTFLPLLPAKQISKLVDQQQSDKKPIARQLAAIRRAQQGQDGGDNNNNSTNDGEQRAQQLAALDVDAELRKHSDNMALMLDFAADH